MRRRKLCRSEVAADSLATSSLPVASSKFCKFRKLAQISLRTCVAQHLLHARAKRKNVALKASYIFSKVDDIEAQLSDHRIVAQGHATARLASFFFRVASWRNDKE